MANRLYKSVNNILYEVVTTKACHEQGGPDMTVYRVFDMEGKSHGGWAFVLTNKFFERDLTPVGYLGEVPPVDFFGDIEQFYRHFELEYDGKPRALPRALHQFRVKFMEEELAEYTHHAKLAYDETTKPIDFRDQAQYTYHLAESLDGLVDLVYVALGTAYLHGFNFNQAWGRVHKANMSKVRATLDSHDKRDPTFDVVKPADWEAPNHSDMVEDNDLREPRGDRA